MEVLVRDPDGNPFAITVEYAEPDTQGKATPLRCVSELRYLGMHFTAAADPLEDWSSDSAAKTLARLSTLRILAASPWASTQLLRTVYLSYVLGASRYGLALAAEGSLKDLEHVHRRALLLITGCHPATTLAMLGAEAGIPSLRDLARQEATVLRELLLRLPPEAPGYRACVKCDKLPGSWLAGAATVCTALGLDELKREKLWSQKPFKPWACPVPTIVPVVPGWSLGPLHFAAKNGSRRTCELLLDRKHDVQCYNGKGDTPLHFAASEGTREAVELLLDRGHEVQCRTMFGVTPLHYAACGGHEEIVELLLDRGHDVQCRTTDGQTRLHFATSYRRPGMVGLLLDRGHDVQCRTAKGSTRLCCV